MQINRDEFRKGILYSLAMNGITPIDLGTFLLEKHAEQVEQAELHKAAGADYLVGLPSMGSLFTGGLNLAESPIVMGGALAAGGGALAGGAAYLATRNKYDKQVTDYQDMETIKQLKLRIAQIHTRMGMPNKNPASIQVST